MYNSLLHQLPALHCSQLDSKSGVNPGCVCSDQGYWACPVGEGCWGRYSAGVCIALSQLCSAFQSLREPLGVPGDHGGGVCGLHGIRRMPTDVFHESNWEWLIPAPGNPRELGVYPPTRTVCPFRTMLLLPAAGCAVSFPWEDEHTCLHPSCTV